MSLFNKEALLSKIKSQYNLKGNFLILDLMLETNSRAYRDNWWTNSSTIASLNSWWKKGPEKN